MMRHTMRLIVIFALATLAAPLASDVPPATPVARIGRLSSGTPPAGPDPSEEAPRRRSGHSCYPQAGYEEWCPTGEERRCS
jgi:hypothetical protein